jgi:uncharacterized protein (UPF0262 family)
VSRQAPACRLVAVELDGKSIGRGPPDVEHERAVALYDLLEENQFEPAGFPDSGPYRLVLGIAEKRLIFDVRDADDRPLIAHALSLTPFRRLVKDYFLICESYYEAIKSGSPSRIEAIDAGRRSLHDEGSRLLQQRLSGKIVIDFDTARRLFTLVCVLHWRG